MAHSQLQDSHGRQFSYLRLSVTDACNFRCQYCLPEGYMKPADWQPPLSIAEIELLARAFAQVGFSKIRLTGGEPTLRPDLVEIVTRLAAIPGIRTLALSTNGFRLKKLSAPLIAAGISQMNISLDSLQEEKFATLTGTDYLPTILEGIERVLEHGQCRVKINAVLLKSTDKQDIELFLRWIKDRPVTVRWIELMPTLGHRDFFKHHHIPASWLREKFIAEGWQPVARSSTSGPAEEWVHADFMGSVGLITPYAPHFCETCNRLRISSTGKLRLCLFGDGETSLRPWLQHASQQDTLIDELRARLTTKQVSHRLLADNPGMNATFSAIGG